MYLFSKGLPLNSAYRAGKARVGCLICPFATTWDDMIVNHEYQRNLAPFVTKLQKYSSQVNISHFTQYLSERKWKVKSLGDRNLEIPQVSFKTGLNDLNFSADIIAGKQSLLAWLPAIGPFSVRENLEGLEGELNYKKQVYPFSIKTHDKKTHIQVLGKLPNDLTFLLRRLVYKTAFCINCEVCEVDCPTGALSIIPKINIDSNKCIHCHKCFNTHDRGCIAADCLRMITDSEKKLGTQVQGYKKFGLRDEWIDEFVISPKDFWKDNSLGTAQVDALKVWLRNADITDSKNNLTELGSVLCKIYSFNPLLFWEIAFINLSYNSFIVHWFCNNINTTTIYNAKTIKEEILNQGHTGSPSTVGNAATAFIDMIKKSPIGKDFCQGIKTTKDGFQRQEYKDLSIEALSYSIYKFAEVREVPILRVSDFYTKNEEHGPYKEFMLSTQNIQKKLRTLSSANERILIAELAMGLEHITLREDMSSIKVLKTLAL